jgi:hypothetical protein
MDARDGVRRGWDRATLVALAAWTWAAVGTGLTVAGVVWLAGPDGTATRVFVPLALLVGWWKARLILTPMARSNVRRLLSGPGRRQLIEVYPPRGWLLAIGFVVLGAVLRRSVLPRDVLGLVYLGVGFGLLLAARAAWIARPAHRASRNPSL